MPTFHWEHRGKLPNGMVAGFGGKIEAENARDALAQVETMLRQKYPTVRWMQDNRVESGNVRYGPTVWTKKGRR